MLFTYLSQTPEVTKLRQQGEEQQALERARERVERAVKGLKDKTASENEEVRQIYKQITPNLTLETTEFGPRSICWKEFKARMIVRGFEMEKGVDYVDNFSPAQNRHRASFLTG